MAFFVLIGLVFALIIYISLAKKKKRALLISIAILGLYHLYVRYSCGPNPWDVRVMKPMANAISDYIVKHGIPKSLSEIPDLPYRLEGCKREESYYGDMNKSTMQYIKLPNRIGANTAYIEEKCSFGAKNRHYYIESRTGLDFKTHKNSMSIEIGNMKSLTWGIFRIKETPKHIKSNIDELHFGSSKTDGICNPMRQ